MRRLLSLVVVLTLVPAASVWATDLDEILERSSSAEYSADQIISCATPDGDHSAFIRLVQSHGELRVSSKVGDGVEVAAGAGAWTLTRPDGLVTGAAVEGGQNKDDALYTVSDGDVIQFLGRTAHTYRLERDGVLRAELIVDDQSGALVQAVTFSADGEVYCERRFVSLDTSPPVISRPELPDPLPTEQTWVEESQLPEEVNGFERLDHYEDVDGFSFAYYSDGFFSFALFETPTTVSLPEGSEIDLPTGKYLREFSAGQVSYVWETAAGGMALIGDLPPDLHEAVLAEMPRPEDPGFLRRWWRSLFG